MTLPTEQPLSQFIEDLLIEAAPNVRPAPVSSEPTRPRLAPDPHAGREPVAQPPARSCGFCHGKPVQDASTWQDGKPRPPAPCPRCGETHA